ncbi:MAG: hypothetical protein K2Q11_00410, partial [Burkholderiaceae bacterium]|nr:hypothetical protein [Burkholderiaceae bacterium]
MTLPMEAKLSRNPENNDLVSVLEQEVRATARSFGISAADAMAASLIDRVLLRLGGEQVYCPKRTHHLARLRHEEILNKFSGNNTRALADEYGLSVSFIRRVVKKGDVQKGNNGTKVRLSQGGFKTEVQHLSSSKVRRCTASPRTT